MTDQVHIGSCTKAMTATLIGMLVESGLLTWSTTIRDVFPELASRLHPDFQKVTLSQLLDAPRRIAARRTLVESAWPHDDRQTPRGAADA